MNSITKTKRVVHKRKGREDKEYFWSLFETPPHSCWIWKAGKTKAGYGRFYLKSGASVAAHRYMYETIFKEKVLYPNIVAHTCHNPSCVNPDHLIVARKGDIIVSYR